MEKFKASFIKRRLDPSQKYGLRLTLLTLAVSLVGVPFGSLLTLVVRKNQALIKVDTLAANYLHEYVRDSPHLVGFLKFISFFGWPPWFWVLIGGVAAQLWIRNRRRLAIYLFSTTILGSVVDTIVKVVVDRPRPSLEEPVATAIGKAFPSGHTMSSTIAYGALLLIFLPFVSRRYKPWAIVGTVALISAIGFSRLALGVHFISDVLGGMALGAGWLVASTAAFEIWREERGRRPTHPLQEGVEPEVVRAFADEETARDDAKASHPTVT